LRSDALRGEEGEDGGKADCAATVLYSLYEAPML
jgi:hypothetical protein